MSEEHYGEPTDSLRSMMKTLRNMEYDLYEIMGYSDIVNKEQFTYMHSAIRKVDSLTELLQHIIDLGDE
jgi:hypothetical protein